MSQVLREGEERERKPKGRLYGKELKNHRGRKKDRKNKTAEKQRMRQAWSVKEVAASGIALKGGTRFSRNEKRKLVCETILAM